MVMTAQQLADLMPDATQLESNEPEMESSLHYAQLALLVACLEWLWRDDLIVELLSPATEKTDRSLKKALYQDRFRTPEYFWFSPETLEFEGYRLVGQHYLMNFHPG
ncbi:hypothetical protein C8255_24385 [filamentous cyanobacterium CCP3]|nr:hypothetical protein C8255_24385 [filamentous cyanobacterium CCP3]